MIIVLVSRAAGTIYHNLGNLKLEKFLLSQFGQPDVKNQGVSHVVPFGGSKGEIALGFQLPVAAHNPWHSLAMAASLQILPVFRWHYSHFFFPFLSIFPPHFLQGHSPMTIHEGDGESEAPKGFLPGCPQRIHLCALQGHAQVPLGQCSQQHREYRPQGQWDVVSIKPIRRLGSRLYPRRVMNS